MKQILLFITLIVLIASCSTEPSGYRLFYFPVDDFSNPKVYRFVNIKQDNDFIFYAIKTIYEKGTKYLHIEIYDKDHNQLESIRQRITSHGAFVDEYISTKDSVKLEMKIYSDTMMLWEVKDNIKFLFEASVNRPEMSKQQIIKKVSHFTGESGKFEFNKINYKTVEMIEDEFFTDGTDATKSQTRIINYADRLGLVSFEINSPNEISRSYILDQILTFPEWKNSQTH